jgi:RNA polymerase sigma factor (sigma-70 family)
MTTSTAAPVETYFQSKYTHEQVLQFIRNYQANKCRRSATAFTEIFFRQLNKLAHGFCKAGIPFDDAFASAVLGMLVGIQKFEIEKYGTKSLSSYIQRAIIDHISKEVRGYTIKIGKTISTTLSMVKEEMGSKSVDFKTACDNLGLTKRRRFAVEQAMNAVGLSGLSDEVAVGLVKDKRNVLDHIIEEESEKAVYARLELLDDKYKEVIKRRLEGQPVKQIASELGVSLPTVSNRYKKGIELLSKES